MEEQKPLVLSQHVKERYAERIRGKEDKSAIGVFVAQNEERIFNDISKMLEYSKLVYTGKTFAKDSNKITNVYLCHQWIIHVDRDSNVVITLYPIDLGLGEDFNRDYVDRLILKIEEATKEWDEEKEKSSKEVEGYKDLIAVNESTIQDYKKTLKSLEEQNEEYKALIISSNARVSVAENKVREIIAKLIGKKDF